MNNFNIFSINPIIYTLDDFIDEFILQNLMAIEFNFKKGETRKNMANDHRKSYVASIENNHPCIELIHKNISNKLNFNSTKIESLQIQKYEKGCFYKPHFDVDTSHIKLNNKNLNAQRRYSIIIYLNDDYQGGETHFPNKNITIKPKLFRALVFENCIRGSNFPNPLSFHEGRKIINGNKYILNTWSYESNYSIPFKFKKN